MAQDYIKFLKFGIKELNQRLILNKELTVKQLCRESLRKIDETRNLNDFITVCSDAVVKRAELLDNQLIGLKNGDSNQLCNKQPLFGVPISIKDNFCIEDTLTTCGSRMLHNFIPPYTATAVQRLIAANCLIMGKTNMDEFAMGSSSTTSYYGATANTWKNEMSLGEKPNTVNSSQWYMAGGSSTGSAVSVASGACFASLATDTGGSARQPASLTGIVGFKPTYGLISRFGLIPLAHCLDVVSILTRNVLDASIILHTVIGLDENDLTSVDHKKYLKSNFSDRRRIRVGVPDEFIENSDMCSEISKKFSKILNHLNKDQESELEVIKLSLPNSKLATECYTVISSAEIASNMSCYDGVKYGFSKDIDSSAFKFDREQYFRENRDEGLGPEVKKRILLGNYFLLEQNRDRYFVQALKLRNMISDEFAKAFSENMVDIIMMPSTPSTSCSHEDWLNKLDKNRLFHEDYFLIPSNLANLPSISVPAGLSSQGLPIGIQMIASRFHDLDLLRIAQIFEEKFCKYM